jgi:hypothetical protein
MTVGCAMKLLGTSIILAALLAPALVLAQQPAPTPMPGERGREVLDKAERIVTQPARDVGVSKVDIPPLLVAAAADPYDLTGLSTCQQLSAEVGRLTEVLGPDLDAPKGPEDSKSEQFATAGGKAVVNSILPFRSLVREVSGAAPAQRALNAAIDAGFARRGFLRGVHRTRSCKTAF